MFQQCLRKNILETFYNACVEAYGKNLCYVRGNYFRVGAKTAASSYDELEGVNWNGTIFASPVTKEYTTNALTYDLGNDIIIDIIVSGVNDTCNHLVRIPVQNSLWWDWMTESEYANNNGLKKLPRYWKLAAEPKAYSAADPETLSFITSNVMELWTNTTYPVETIFRQFYCSIVRGKVQQDGCYVNTAPNAGLLTKIEAYNAAFENDMGFEWYDTFVVNQNVNRIVVDNFGNSYDTEISTLKTMVYSLIGTSAALFASFLVMGCYLWSTRDQLSKLKLATDRKFTFLDGTLVGFSARLDQSGHEFSHYLEAVGADFEEIKASIRVLGDRVTALEAHAGIHHEAGLNAPLMGDHHA